MLTTIGVWVFGDALPVPPRVGIYPAPLLLAAVYGLLTAGAFALWPLARAAQISGAALFRDALLPTRLRHRPALLAMNAALALAARRPRRRDLARAKLRRLVLRGRRRHARCCSGSAASP